MSSFSDKIRKYRPFPQIDLPGRAWPGRTISKAPIWLSTDLRDGNQSLFSPMDSAQKTRVFQMLTQLGFKEIEVAFPSASQTDFDFVRNLIEGGLIPDDVTVSVLTQARDHLIRRTVDSMVGARSAIIHVYNATAPTFRDKVFHLTKEEVKTMAVDSVKLIRQLTDAHPDTRWTLEYSPEIFASTELPFAKEVCDAVMQAWGATPERKVILNLPATVEVATPNVYADQIEWMCRHLDRRDCAIISLHPHNDRGTAVAAAELGLLAGADRVEGCLFGHGERTGNACLVTLALNLFTQGVDPKLDFSNLPQVAATIEELTELPVHPRHPYGGDLVFTAFSGSHQDAIKKGFTQQDPEGLWDVPYLPIDPADIGRTYESIIRVNSQSGKGGVAHVLESAYGLAMPRRLQIEFSGIIKAYADAHGGEIDAATIWQLFSEAYLDPKELLSYQGHRLIEEDDGRQGIDLRVRVRGRDLTLHGVGNGPIDAAMRALCRVANVVSYEERSMGQGAESKAAAFVEVGTEGLTGANFGVGIHENIATASIMAVVSAVARLVPRVEDERREAWVARVQGA